jgi:hypothetical protein
VNPPPGLSTERTRLAWRRTTLAVAVVTLLAGRLALSGGTAGAILAGALLVGWLTIAVSTYPRIAGRRPPGGGLALPIVALATAGYAGLGILLILTALG